MENEGFYLEVRVSSSSEKLFYYCLNKDIKVNDYVIVETNFGIEMGIVCKEPKKESESEGYSCKQILKVANEEELMKILED